MHCLFIGKHPSKGQRGKASGQVAKWQGASGAQLVPAS